MNISPDNRRDRARVTVASGSLDAEVLPESSLTLRLVNVSVSGCAVLASGPLGEVDTQLTLRFGNRELALWRPASCRLCYLIANKPPYEIVGWLHGLRFDPLPAGTMSFIADYVEHRRVRGRELVEVAR